MLAKNYFFLAKNLIFKFCLLLSRGITGGMKTIYSNVLFHISTELPTKNTHISLCTQNFFFWQRIWFSNFAYYITEASQEVWKPFILTFYPVSIQNYLPKTPKIRFASKKIFFLAKKFDLQILLITFKWYQRRHKNRLLSRSIPSQYRIIYKNIEFSFC